MSSEFALSPPRKRPMELLRLVGWAVALAFLVWSWRGAEMRPMTLITESGNILTLIKDFFPPDFTDWRLYATEMVVTLQVAIWGTLLAVVCAVPLGILSSDNIVPWWVYHPVRRLMDAARAINEMVFAMLFVVAVGLGPFAGVLALSVLTGCGNGSGSGTVDYTSQVVGALQNYFDTNGEYDDVEIKIIEGNTAMKTQLKQLVSKVLDSDVSFEGVTEEKEVFQAILKNQELTAEIAGMFPTAVLDDPTQPLYRIGLVSIVQPINKNNIASYAKILMERSSEVNLPEGIGDNYDESTEMTVAVTTVTINNQEYMVGLFSLPIFTTDLDEGTFED